MSGTVRTWSPDMERLDAAVAAIGVFDGVHLGHQALLRDAVADAGRRGVLPIVVTFDRDPDQVVTPQTAAPQLLTLDDKCRFIRQCGIRVVLVVPFDAEMASTPAEVFLDEVLSSVVKLRSVHVGRDFRFGQQASGDLDTLYVWGVEHNVDVVPHDLVEHDGAPITSTRVRGLVASGDVEQAAELLGRPARVSGTVHIGRRQGASIGFPTANVEPVPFAALPADGVYAGYVELENGSWWPSAISVGTPPSFPEARDYLEAHLIGFEGDLYDANVSLEFVARLRDLAGFESLERLKAAITEDVARASEMLEAPPDDTGTLGEDGYDTETDADSAWGLTSAAADGSLMDGYASDDELVDDPEALAAAERAAAEVDPDAAYAASDGVWVELVGPQRLSGFWSTAGFSASLITMPLDAAGIPFVWEPYPPDRMPSFRPAYGAFDRGFQLLVPEERLPEAQHIIAPALSDFDAEWAQEAEAEGEETASETPDAVIPPPGPVAPFDFGAQHDARRRKTMLWAFLFAFFVLDIGVLVMWLLGVFD